VQSLNNGNGNVAVTYAPEGPTAQRRATSGQGAVAIFSESGALRQTDTELAPDRFGNFWR
jgi:hypothetical protein